MFQIKILEINDLYKLAKKRVPKMFLNTLILVHGHQVHINEMKMILKV